MIAPSATIALGFDAPLSLEALCDRLNRIGPFHFRVSESDTHGDHLWCVLDENTSLSVYGERPRWVVQASVLPGSAWTHEQMEREIAARILPAIGARNVHPTDTWA